MTTNEDASRFIEPMDLGDLAYDLLHGDWNDSDWQEAFHRALAHLRELDCRSAKVTALYQPEDPDAAATVEDAEREAARREAACYLATVDFNIGRLSAHFSRSFEPSINPVSYLEEHRAGRFDEWAERTRYVRELKAELEEIKACC